jgi:hypothetical protein
LETARYALIGDLDFVSIKNSSTIALFALQTNFVLMEKGSIGAGHVLFSGRNLTSGCALDAMPKLLARQGLCVQHVENHDKEAIYLLTGLLKNEDSHNSKISTYLYKLV